MAGGDYHPFKVDPAIERWQEMHNTMYQRFRLTRKNTPFILFWGIAFPAMVYFACDWSHNRWDMRARRRGESLLRQPKTKTESKEEEK